MKIKKIELACLPSPTRYNRSREKKPRPKAGVFAHRKGN
jgi:hypothetical protein